VNGQFCDENGSYSCIGDCLAVVGAAIAVWLIIVIVIPIVIVVGIIICVIWCVCRRRSMQPTTTIVTATPYPVGGVQAQPAGVYRM